MSAAIGVATDGVRMPLPRALVMRVATGVLASERVRDAMISVAFVGKAQIRRLNKAHLGRAGTTDVISFGFRRSGRRAPIVGDVYIAPDVARESAKANGVPVREELVRLVVHGTLHVLGYDHPESAQRTGSPMWRKQERLVERFMRSR